MLILANQIGKRADLDDALALAIVLLPGAHPSARTGSMKHDDVPTIRLRYRCHDGGVGRIIAGLWEKKLKGMSVKPFHIVDITDQSSMCGTWWKPIEYQVTMSVSWIGDSA